MNTRSLFSTALLYVVFFVFLFQAQSLHAQAAPATSKELPKEPAPKAEADNSDFWSRMSLETGVELDSGKFGAKARSVFVSFPTTLAYDHDGVIASVTVPYVIQRTRGNAVRVGGRVIRLSGVPQKRAKTAGGLGDILVDGGYYVNDSSNEVPYLLLDGEVKIPTADDERGLGTGSPDETLRATTGMTLWDHVKLTANLGYQFIGQPEDTPSNTLDFHNAVNFGGGVGYKFSTANTLWAKVDGSSSIVPRTSPYLLVYGEWDHTFKNDSRLLISLGSGLTKSTPGLSFEISYLFWF